MNSLILLSFDIEEFDVPEEYGQSVDDREKLEISLEGLKTILELLDQHGIRATFFVTAYFATHYPDIVRQLAQTHELASHGYYHSSFEVPDLKRSRETLEVISHTPVRGYRMARLQPVDDGAIAAAGYTYNSSMNPTYLPGRYNHFFESRTPFYSGSLLNIPVSVTPLIRFPLFWLSFKNLPLGLIRWLTGFTLRCDRQVNLYFHPWEFVDISRFHLPGYIKRHSGQAMVRRLKRYLTWLQTQGEFITFSEFQTVWSTSKQGR
jgi:hypothetical protein